jgi:ethanolamine ammonia-lyase small subunit
MKSLKVLDDLRALRTITAARIGLPRAGSSIATSEMLAFDLDHARARDAVHLPFQTDLLVAGLHERGLDSLQVHSAAADRASYLQRPDLGRRLNAHSRAAVLAAAADSAPDLVLVIGDGLSTAAIHANALPLLDALLPLCQARHWRLAPVVVANQARVALADEVGECLGARVAVHLIGERPGLSAADSMGIYLTYAPRVGRTDAQRNCISNIRDGGLDHTQAASLLVRLLTLSLQRELSGVALKDDCQLIEQLDSGD